MKYECDYCPVKCKLEADDGAKQPFTCPYDEGAVRWMEVDNG